MKLTKKQGSVLKFISNFIMDHSYPPTYSEIANEFQVSTTTIQEYIEALTRKGYLEKLNGVARGFVVKNKCLNSFTKTKSNFKLVPILGSIQAGEPILASEHVLGYVSFDYKFSSQKLFALYVKGDSMIGAGILEKDIVIARSQNYAEAGEIVIALLRDEVTLKRLRRDNSGYYLKAENNKYKPIRCEFKILGKVIGLKRNKFAVNP